MKMWVTGLRSGQLGCQLKHKDLAPYEKCMKTHGLRWLVVEQPDGTLREKRFCFSAFDDPYMAEG